MNILNLNFSKFYEQIKTIDYGYIDRKNIRHPGLFSVPDDNYLLQKPDRLIKSKLGLCFDIVEMYREYFKRKNYPFEAYYMEYKGDEFTECHSFIIYRRKNKMWFEAVDNSWESEISPDGYYDKKALIKSIYGWFQEYVEEQHGKTDKNKFFLTLYKTPEPVFRGKQSLRSFCTEGGNKTNRPEYSGMAIVFCQGKVLLLKTKHNEYVFPKGHIENGETSKEASIRECLEESGISIKDAEYYGECGNYAYTFSGGHLKITAEEFRNTFGVDSITKKVFAHVYKLKEFREFNPEKIFVTGCWIDIDNVSELITHENTKKIFMNALALYRENETK